MFPLWTKVTSSAYINELSTTDPHPPFAVFYSNLLQVLGTYFACYFYYIISFYFDIKTIATTALIKSVFLFFWFKEEDYYYLYSQ